MLSSFCLGPDESSAFQTLGKQAQPVPIPPEQLDQIPAPSTEDEDMSGKRILFQHRLD